ncbi:MAG: protein phosphatase 2C domain-containing protein [Dolichospermum sp. DET50]|nr:protein phosphatase 2C domain-containing protein [Dolichospermum sp. DET66]MBS3032097.1 protein phosphatase 2C domain-containing protein [Dolichospermum sp. DET67]MBS3037301.1 protein phosphatase 2C domain-containing protein [Dolichospermum sp. DET50]QSX69293.1 MAG: protein phosphatase 2C domain-containing protein [Dolichospermum sp. DET69]
MENDAVTLCCPNEYCQSANPLTHKFCQQCSTPLPKRYLWAVGDALDHYHPGSILADTSGQQSDASGGQSQRYLVINKSILLDIKPGLLPQIPELDDVDKIKPYLKLIPYRLHIPQVYGVFNLSNGQIKTEILLLERPPLIIDATITQANLCSTLDTVWSEASSIRQLHWLWQLANLWQPLAIEGVASSLIDPYVLRVEGVLIRLLELRFDGKNPPTLSQLGEFWRQLLKNTKPNIAPFVQQVCDLLIQGEINSSSQLIQILDQGLSQLEKFQTTTIKIYTKTDSGPSRPRNEDACYPCADTLINKPPQNNALAIVCDGIGGHEGGNVASNLAIETIKQQVKELTSLPDDYIDPSMLLSDLERAVATANDKISQRNDSENRQGRQRMGTTIVMALPVAHEMYITHVGDSRAYWITRHSCHQVTLDDDVACREVRLGYALYREALQHNGSGSLVQALGMGKSTSLHPTSQRFIIDEDAVFLLTSDGLSDFDRVEESWETEILPLLSGKTSIEDVAQRLIEVANTKNGHDNVTVALVHYDVKYSEPDIIITANIFNLLANTLLDPFADPVNGESFINNQKTQVIAENKNIKLSQVPLQLLIILGLTLFAGLLGYWFKLQLKSPTKIFSSPSPFSTQLPNLATPRTLQNLSTNWVIQANSPITVNNKTFPAESFFQVMEKKANPNAEDNPQVLLRVCKQSNSAPQTSKTVQLNFSELQNLAKDISILQSDQRSPCGQTTDN